VAKIQTLGLPAGPVKGMPDTRSQMPVKSTPDVAEYGASGTPIFGGFLRERGEYNPDLVGLQAIATYEQMRRSDAQVAATLMAIKLPIRSAVWEVTVDDDASPVRRFVKKTPLDYPVVIGDAALAREYGGVLGLPATYLIDSQGRIVSHHVGETDLKALRAEIAALIAKHQR